MKSYSNITAYFLPLLLVALYIFVFPKEWTIWGWPLILLVSILADFLQSKKRKTGFIDFKTKNDHYLRGLPFILGPILIIGGILTYLYLETEPTVYIALGLTGVLFLISGIKSPKGGYIQLKSGQLTFKADRYKTFTVNEIKEVNLYPDKMTIKSMDLVKFSLLHLDLNNEDLLTLRDFLDSTSKGSIVTTIKE